MKSRVTSRHSMPLSKGIAFCLFAGVVGLATSRLFAAAINPPPTGCSLNLNTFVCDDHCNTQPHTCETDIDGACTPC